MSIVYKNGSLFNAPSDGILLHACNSFGVWGSGVAKTFHSLYPQAYLIYEKYCGDALANLDDLRGDSIVIVDESSKKEIICLFTSRGFGAYVDKPDQILDSTKKSLNKLSTLLNGRKVEIHSPKINSGLFKVPWERTETLINEFLNENPNVSWFVWSL